MYEFLTVVVFLAAASMLVRVIWLVWDDASITTWYSKKITMHVELGLFLFVQFAVMQESAIWALINVGFMLTFGVAAWIARRFARQEYERMPELSWRKRRAEMRTLRKISDLGTIDPKE
ncbi:MAG: hypothetical protein WBP12_05435 [Candidatus Saccharimonas sp.]